jgi:nucleotide-binding universal stress UspA family protein
LGLSWGMNTILVALDFSPVSAAVCDTAFDLAVSLRARVVLTHCVEPRYVPDDMGLMAEYLVTLTAAAEKAARRDLTRHRRRFTAASLPVTTLCLRGRASGAILDEAGRLPADWIVLGSHGHTAIYELMVGSTTHRVLSGACCPVIVVPATRSLPGTNKKCTSPAK